MSRGYIYIASNNVGGVKSLDYVREAIFSATSLKKIDSKAHITLITDKEINEPVFNKIMITKLSLRSKQDVLNLTPYDKTIYVDTDTYFKEGITDVFQLLEKYDVAMIHDYARKRIFRIPEYMAIPEAFSEVNGGIMAYKKNNRVSKFLKLWKNIYNKYKHVVIWDQPSVRMALWYSDVKLYILPIEYNRRSKKIKQKCINCKKNGDPRFPKNHLNTKIFHFHGLEGMSNEQMENEAQDF